MEPHPVHPWRMNLLPAELSAAPSSPTHSAASPSQKGTHGSLTSKQKIRYIWAFISFPLGCSAERLFVFKSLGVTSGWFCLQYERVHWTTLTFLLVIWTISWNQHPWKCPKHEQKGDFWFCASDDQLKVGLDGLFQAQWVCDSIPTQLPEGCLTTLQPPKPGTPEIIDNFLPSELIPVMMTVSDTHSSQTEVWDAGCKLGDEKCCLNELQTKQIKCVKHTWLLSPSQLNPGLWELNKTYEPFPGHDGRFPLKFIF